ncbi:MAG: hypothetical protein FWE74_04950 [Oscillospiraceae bacterium]|nr:hypothetical protein [Oscillospiraceae bacterium]
MKNDNKISSTLSLIFGIITLLSLISSALYVIIALSNADLSTSDDLGVFYIFYILFGIFIFDLLAELFVIISTAMLIAAIGFPFSVAGTVLGIIAIIKKPTGKAIAGLLLSAGYILLSIILIILGLLA